jgi:hypothetical protein
MKLSEMDYVVEYKMGKEKKVADALSRQDNSLQAISSVTPS